MQGGGGGKNFRDDKWAGVVLIIQSRYAPYWKLCVDIFIMDKKLEFYRKKIDAKSIYI